MKEGRAIKFNNEKLPSIERELRRKIKKFGRDRGKTSTKIDVDERNDIIVGKKNYQEVNTDTSYDRRSRVNPLVLLLIKSIEKRYPSRQDYFEELKERIQQNAYEDVDLWMLGLTSKIARSLGENGIMHHMNEKFPSYTQMASHALNSVGTSINGSCKSRNGKALGNDILRESLGLLGIPVCREQETFYAAMKEKTRSIAYLSCRKKGHREIDVAIYLMGQTKYVCCDFTFSSEGNTEVAGDKAGRYQNSDTVCPLIMVPSIGSRGAMRDVADRLKAKIVEFGGKNIPLCLAEYLRDEFGFSHEILVVPGDLLEQWTYEKLQQQKKGRKNEPSRDEHNENFSTEDIINGETELQSDNRKTSERDLRALLFGTDREKF